MRQRQPRINDEGHRKRVKRLHCCLCGRSPVDATHIRYSDEARGKQNPGLGRKPSDTFVVPLCREHHDQQHRGNEQDFWAGYDVDPLRLADLLYCNTYDPEILDMIVDAYWKEIRRRKGST